MQALLARALKSPTIRAAERVAAREHDVIVAVGKVARRPTYSRKSFSHLASIFVVLARPTLLITNCLDFKYLMYNKVFVCFDKIERQVTSCSPSYPISFSLLWLRSLILSPLQVLQQCAAAPKCAIQDREEHLNLIRGNGTSHLLKRERQCIASRESRLLKAAEANSAVDSGSGSTCST